jgi:hypothetical protein
MSHRSCSLVVVVGLALLGTLAGCTEPVKAPTAYKKWNAKDGTFACEYPEDWKADGGGSHGVQWAEFKKGPCVISVDTNVSGSVVADIAGSTDPGSLGGEEEPIDPKIAEQNAPAAAAHDWIKNSDQTRFEKFKGYKEEEPVKITPPVGEGRKSLFTATTGGRKVKGYRITIPTNKKAIIVFAYGPEKDWSKLQGAYDKIFDGMEQGTEM